MIRSMRGAVPALLLVLAAPAARAQGAAELRVSPSTPVNAPVDARLTSSAPQTAPESATVAQAGPTVRNAAVGVKAPKMQLDPAPAPKPAETRQNEAMMIVGGAALVVGAIIGGTAGTIFMVGGAGVGLYGLYKYLE
jgi:hypothetical protein